MTTRAVVFPGDGQRLGGASRQGDAGTESDLSEAGGDDVALIKRSASPDKRATTAAPVDVVSSDELFAELHNLCQCTSISDSARMIPRRTWARWALHIRKKFATVPSRGEICAAQRRVVDVIAAQAGSPQKQRQQRVAAAMLQWFEHHADKIATFALADLQRACSRQTHNRLAGKDKDKRPISSPTSQMTPDLFAATVCSLVRKTKNTEQLCNEVKDMCKALRRRSLQDREDFCRAFRNLPHEKIPSRDDVRKALTVDVFVLLATTVVQWLGISGDT